MKKIRILLMLLCITLGSQAQILWKISGKDLTKSSYILGTHHLAPISIMDSIADFKKSLNEVEQVYGELVMQEMTSPANIQKMQQAMVIPGDTTLHTLLTPAQYDSVAACVKQLMGIDLQMMDKMKPAFISSQMEMIMAMKSIKDFKMDQQLDGWVQEEALRQGKKVGALETVEMQIDVLFNSQTLQRQAQQLYATVKHFDESYQVLQKMTASYMRQDLKQLETIMNTKKGDESDALPEEENALIYDRNNDWSKMMPAIMKEHATLFAVGAGHLVGERGVLALLKKLGYTLEPVK